MALRSAGLLPQEVSELKKTWKSIMEDPIPHAENFMIKYGDAVRYLKL